MGLKNKYDLDQKSELVGEFQRYFSFWPYFLRHRSPDWPINKNTPINIPMGYSEFPKEIFLPPISLASQFYKNIVLWSSHDSGGHFAAMEKPRELAGDINKFVKEIL